MICERCKKSQATVFYEESVNGKSRSLSLCADCAKELEAQGDISMPSPGNMFEDFMVMPGFGTLGDSLFGGLFGLPEISAAAHAREKSCPLCHATLRDFQKNGKTGCPECYKTFAEELKETIRSIHGNVRHVGRTPIANRRLHEKEKKLAELKSKLKTAVSEENFEEAARLRDMIRGMENNG